MFTDRETIFIRIALWVILAGFITGALLGQTSPFIAIAGLMAIGTACIKRNLEDGVSFKTTVAMLIVSSMGLVMRLGFYLFLT